MAKRSRDLASALRLDPERYATGPFRRPAVEPEVARVVSADGTQLHVRSYGPADAAPIVLIHGWVCAIEYWNPQINALAGPYRVIAFDQRGHGRSEPGPQPVTSGRLADDLAAVLSATVDPRRPATLIGHSMGGVTILAWAAKYPDRVERYASAAMLASTAADLVGERINANVSGRHARVQARLVNAAVQAPESSPLLWLSRNAFRRVVMTSTASREAVDFCQRVSFSCPDPVRRGWAAALRRTDVSDGVAALTIPTTVLYGEQDGLLSPSASKRTCALVATRGNLSREVELLGVGHATNLEAVERFNAEIVDLRTLPRPGNRHPDD